MTWQEAAHKSELGLAGRFVHLDNDISKFVTMNSEGISRVKVYSTLGGSVLEERPGMADEVEGYRDWEPL